MSIVINLTHHIFFKGVASCTDGSRLVRTTVPCGSNLVGRFETAISSSSSAALSTTVPSSSEVYLSCLDPDVFPGPAHAASSLPIRSGSQSLTCRNWKLFQTCCPRTGVPTQPLESTDSPTHIPSWFEMFLDSPDKTLSIGRLEPDSPDKTLSIGRLEPDSPDKILSLGSLVNLSPDKLSCTGSKAFDFSDKSS